MGMSIAPQGKVKMGGICIAECYDKHGNFKWILVAQPCTDQGLQNMLDVTFTRAAPSRDTWYLGLTSTGPTFAAATRWVGTHGQKARTIGNHDLHGRKPLQPDANNSAVRPPSPLTRIAPSSAVRFVF
jgi:hypothetical protein